MLPNVERLAGRVDDVELLLFSVDEDVPPPEQVARLVDLKQHKSLSYTLHTPLDASLASADERRRLDGVDKVRRALDWARPLEPLGCTVHVYFGDREHDPSPPADVAAWRARATRSLETLMRDGAPICVECIDYDFALIAPVVRALDLSVALDVGHLLRDGRALGPMLDAWLGRARILQLHGTRVDRHGARDHVSLRHAPRDELERLMRALRGWNGVLTLEVFDERDLDESLAIIDSIVCWGATP